MARHIPFVYVQLAQDFLKRLEEEGQAERIRYFEHYQQDWTFHCKGEHVYHMIEHVAQQAITCICTSTKRVHVHTAICRVHVLQRVKIEGSSYVNLSSLLCLLLVLLLFGSSER